ncbi:unnamed protein product [Closterium sp. NIES-65]|nr:unnamed protein product [Closterium sp. NIES-65]
MMAQKGGREDQGTQEVRPVVATAAVAAAALEQPGARAAAGRCLERSLRDGGGGTGWGMDERQPSSEEERRHDSPASFFQPRFLFLAFLPRLTSSTRGAVITTSGCSNAGITSGCNSCGMIASTQGVNDGQASTQGISDQHSRSTTPGAPRLKAMATPQVKAWRRSGRVADGAWSGSRAWSAVWFENLPVRRWDGDNIRCLLLEDKR